MKSNISSEVERTRLFVLRDFCLFFALIGCKTVDFGCSFSGKAYILREKDFECIRRVVKRVVKRESQGFLVGFSKPCLFQAVLIF